MAAELNLTASYAPPTDAQELLDLAHAAAHLAVTTGVSPSDIEICEDAYDSARLQFCWSAEDLG